VALTCPPDMVINTDASLSGWGASTSSQDHTSVGWWRRPNQLINVLELKAIYNALWTKPPQLTKNKSVLFC